MGWSKACCPIGVHRSRRGLRGAVHRPARRCHRGERPHAQILPGWVQVHGKGRGRRTVRRQVGKETPGVLFNRGSVGGPGLFVAMCELFTWGYSEGTPLMLSGENTLKKRCWPVSRSETGDISGS